MTLPPTRPKYFLELFAGIHSRLSVAAKELDLDRFAPFDIELDASHDILDDDAFHMLRRLAWSGLIGLAFEGGARGRFELRSTWRASPASRPRTSKR